MGLFSFFSKKTGDRRKTNVFSKVRPRVSSTAESFPVGDSKPTACDRLEISSRHGLDLGKTRLSSDSASISDTAAPRLREEDIERRPSTAPGSRPPSLAFAMSEPRSKRDGKRRPPPLSFRMPLAGTAAPRLRPGSRGSERTVTSVFGRLSGRSRASSLQSDAGKGFKDVLDAQSEIKPADFKARVQAAGARDYGEDVAERNMGENGFNLGSPHVQAFYARSPTPSQAGWYGGVLAGYGLRPATNQPYIRKRPFRPLSQNFASAHPHPNGVLSSELGAQGQEHLGRRRRSVNTFMPLNSQNGRSDSPFDRSLGFLEDQLAELSIPAAEDDFQCPSVGLSAPPAQPRRPGTSASTVSRAARPPRDSIMLAKRKADASSPRNVREGISSETASPIRPTSRHRTSSTFGPSSSIPRMPQHSYTLPSPNSPAADRDGVPRSISPRRNSLKHQTNKRSEMILDQVDAETRRPSSRNLSLTPVAETDAGILPDEEVLDYPPPIRTRTLRSWSVSSGTPTASDSITTVSVNSSPFQRPHSLHTADTSVDMALGSAVSLVLKPRPCSRDDHGCSILGLENDHATTETTATSHINETDITARHHSYNNNNNNLLSPTHLDEKKRDGDGTFNMDDYLSTDDSATTPNRRPTAEGEEDLLFDDEFGYGGSGLQQLPGLADPFPSTSPTRFEEGGAAARLLPTRLPVDLCFGGCGNEHGDGDGYDGGDNSDGLAGRRHRVAVCGDGDDDDHRKGRGNWMSEEWRERRRRMTRRYILDTAADDEDSGSEAGSEGGYERDGDGGEEDAHSSTLHERIIRRTRKKRTMRTMRLAALCQVDSRATEEEKKDLPGEGQEQRVRVTERERHQEEREREEEEEEEETPGEILDVAAAVRLRKQAKRARREAGQASAPRLRRHSVWNPASGIPGFIVEDDGF
ncbi:hypothetical protein VTK26DRAFT_7802 [Humicola hyalothermophila]